MGETALAFFLVIAALSAFMAVFWFAVWFVEVRKMAFVRMQRSEADIGNWKGIFGEVKRNLKGHKDL